MEFTEITIPLILTLAVSTLYLGLSIRMQEVFFRHWGFAWMTYSIGLVFLFAHTLHPSQNILEVRKAADMLHLVLLLFSSYSFVHARIPSYWYRFSLYLLLLAAFCMLYHTEPLSFYLPISIFQMVVTGFICYNVYSKWGLSDGKIAGLTSLLFLFWGSGKAVFSIVEIFRQISGYYVIELLVSNLIHFCMMELYMASVKEGQEAEEHLYRNIITHSKDVFFSYQLSPFHACTYISPSIQQMTGFTQKEFYKEPLIYRTAGTEKSIPELQDFLTEFAEGKETYVWELNRKDGSRFWGECSVSVIFDKKGNPVAAEGMLRDVTESKTAAMEQISIARSRNTLLSYISHELRTPITSIAGYLTAIHDGTMSSDEERGEAMEIITAKTLTLKKLIDDLDQLSKLETHSFRFDFTICSVRELAAELQEEYLPDIRAAGFQVTADCDMQRLADCQAVLDQDRIHQVFSNLMTNAVKYSEQDKRIHLFFGTDKAKENFVVSVTDHGMGIKESQIPHIFERFYRAPHNENGLPRISGQGLGLTLCREIMNAHQGEIFAESVYGKGSTFTFVIPLYKED